MSKGWQDQLKSLKTTFKTNDLERPHEISKATQRQEHNPLNDLTQRIAEGEKVIQELRNEKSQSDARNDTLLEQVEGLRRELKASQSRHILVNKINVELEAELATAKARETSLEADLIHTQTAVNNLLGRVSELTDDVNRTTISRDHLLERVQNADAEVAKFDALAPRLNELGELMLKADELETERRSLKGKLTKLERVSVATEALLVNTQKKLEKSTEQRKELKQQLVAAQDKYSELESAQKISRANENKLVKRLRAAEALSAAELIIRDRYTAQWIIENAIESRQWNVFFPDAKIALTGEGPWDGFLLEHLLKQAKIKSTSRVDKNVEIIIVGREAVDLQFVEEMINVRNQLPIKIYPQELFVAALLANQDPFEQLALYSDPETECPDLYEMVVRFGKGHPVIEYLQSEQFPWPNSDVIHDGTQTGDWAQVEETPLVKMGYHVGVTKGLPASRRQSILANAFEGEIPFVESDEYMETWGRAASRQRLARMAYHLAMLIRSRKNLASHSEARREWQEDLDWLSQYYRPLMRFRWPI